MNIAICDDIKEYRNSLNIYISEYMKLHSIDCNIYEFNSGNSLIESKAVFDILFLDIELGDSNGIDIAKQIQLKNKNLIILIVTSYHQYLDDAMDINVTRYIDKPISQERIFLSLDKAISELNGNIITVHHKDNRIIRLKSSEVVYIEARLRQVTIYTIDEHYNVKENLKSLRAMFVGTNFATPHNSYIVNLNYIKCFKREEIHLAKPYENQRISVASRKQPEFKRKFLDFIGEDCSND